MPVKIPIQQLLEKTRRKTLRKEDQLILEVNRALTQQQFSKENVLQHLDQYIRSFEYLDEENLEEHKLYRPQDIRQCCIRYRLKFLDTQFLKSELPYQAQLTTEQYMKEQRKKNIHLKVLGSEDAFRSSQHDPKNSGVALFAETVNGNYYLLQSWGAGIPRSRWYWVFPVRSIESLMLCVILFSFIITLITPTILITSDKHALGFYFSLYRAAWFFHVFILVAAMVVFRFFAHKIYFSSSVWNTEKDR